MKRIIGIATAIVLMTMPAMAQQAGGGGGGKMYVGAGLGLTFLGSADSSGTIIGIPWTSSQEYDAGYEFFASVGYKVTPNVRVEGEIGYAMNDYGTYTFTLAGFPSSADLPGTASTLTAIVSGYYDFSAMSGLVPYVGAGVGLANASISGTGAPDEDDTALAWQLAAGAGYAISPQMTLDIRYRLMGADFTFPSGGTYDGIKHSVGVGVRLGF